MTEGFESEYKRTKNSNLFNSKDTIRNGVTLMDSV